MKSDLLYVDHVIETANVIASYLFDVSLESFLDNRMLCDAVMRNLQILSESTQKISNEIKDKYPNIPWKDISGFRNILTHDYIEDIDLQIVWNVTANKLPELHDEFIIIRDEIRNNSSNLR
jgi:uncharacterized protein with HEPN domain